MMRARHAPARKGV